MRPLGYADGMEFCRELPGRVGVVAIPSVVFYDNVDAGRSQVRFAFCKRQDVLAEALSRLARAGRGAAGQEAGRGGTGRGQAGRGGAGLGD